VQTTKSSLAALTLSAIGVVYGDIGTSVLYAMKEVFGSGHVPFTPDNIYGILSIFFWTLTVIVSIKYVAWWRCWHWRRKRSKTSLNCAVSYL
jgi:KUP system potassium uptake protein